MKNRVTVNEPTKTTSYSYWGCMSADWNVERENEHTTQVRDEILILFGIVEAGAGYNGHSQDFINECEKRMLQLETDNPLIFE
jgi:hypothetical protein